MRELGAAYYSPGMGTTTARTPKGRQKKKSTSRSQPKAPAGKSAAAKKKATKATSKKRPRAKAATAAPPKATKKTARRRPKGTRSPSPEVAALQRRIDRLQSLLDVAKAMTAETDLDSLLELILGEAIRVINADRCTLWIVDHDRNEMWTKVAHGLQKDARIRIPVGVGIAGQVAQTGQAINIPDAYADARFNPQVDKDTGYRTRNILAVPMYATTRMVTGVLQALNRKDGEAFSEEDQEILQALGANAAAAIENAILYQEIDGLFEGFVKASVVAIESRDPTTSGHSERVAILTTGIAEHVDRIDHGPLRNLHFTRADMQEIRYAALLHDFGKVGVRENVLVKAKKLYPSELEILETRFAALVAQRENARLRAAVESLRQGKPIPADLDATLAKELEEIKGILEFVRKCNEPTVLEQGGFEKLRDLSNITFEFFGEHKPVLGAREIQSLAIPRGSLNREERLEIESHVTHTYRFLAQIPWTRKLRRVPEIAYAHHEKLDGGGYPRRLQADQIPVQSRMMTIADIYDALTASDRPYKRAVPHEKALSILEHEAKLNRLDRVLLDIFIEGRVYKALPTMRPA